MVSGALLGDAGDRLAQSAARWRERALAAGEMLWYEADPADELALVVEGRLEVEVTGQRISELGPGELVGEAAAFVLGEKRTAAVRAPGPLAPPHVAPGGPGGAAPGRRRAHTTCCSGARCWRPRAASKRRWRGWRARPGEVPLPDDRRSAGRSTRAHPAVGAEVPASTRVRPCACCRCCGGAPDDAIAAIQAAMVPERVSEGDALLVEGDAGDRLLRAGRGAPGGVPPVPGAPACA